MKRDDSFLGARPIFWIAGGLAAIAGIGYGLYKGKGKIMDLASGLLGRTDWIKAMAAAFDRVVPNMDEPFRSSIGKVQQTILISQAGHESGFGKGAAAKAGHNFWNLTAGSKWTGPVFNGKDTEYRTETSTPINITQKFRVYDSDDAAIADMLRFIGPGTRYAKAWAALVAGQRDQYLAELRSAGFYTQPLADYTKGVASLMPAVVSAMAS
jgi:hypothetical protein